ncbi:MAG: methylase protein [Bryobacterales bacterium]|nr:methylase protein [Bryobacterales bacterium]
MTVVRGDCVNVMKAMPSTSVDFIPTDPPYLVRYCDRSGRSVKNDDNDVWLDPAFAQMYRVLKDNRFCVSFYAWNKVDRFVEAWKKAGFHIAGHIVFTKKYASSARFMSYQHEQAYLLAKGNPAPPSNPPPDVIAWTYTGNKLHPTQKPVGIFVPLIEAFTKPGDTVLDPFCGSGSALVAAQDLGRRVIGIELDEAHHRTASQRLAEKQPGLSSKFHQVGINLSRFAKPIIVQPLQQPSKFHVPEETAWIPEPQPATQMPRPPVIKPRAIAP